MWRNADEIVEIQNCQVRQFHVWDEDIKEKVGNSGHSEEYSDFPSPHFF